MAEINTKVIEHEDVLKTKKFIFIISVLTSNTKS